jgi:pSer/pThr/pTyr-binding forkhead associated (FHA) protein
MTGIVAFVLRIVLIGFLYTFLIWALYTLWIDLRKQGKTIKNHRVPVIVLSGEVGNSVDFAIPEITIGRDSTCDFQIEEETVSTKHARLTFHHNQWWLEDLQSTNGTYLNRERIFTPTVIVAGDEIMCGQKTLLLQIKDMPEGKSASI